MINKIVKYGCKGKYKVTACPRPKEVFISLETAIKEHIPRKLASKMLLVNIAAKNITNGLTVIIR